ncbi:MAG: Tol-Pal system protein TolB [Campylobacterales bacterium]|nr:Tol-Pal system protein TolB [Campylobacterales bacterium]
MTRILLFFIFITGLVANDPTIDVVKKVSNTYKIKVLSNTKEKDLQRLDRKIKYMLKADLKLTGVFRILDDNSKVKPDFIFRFQVNNEEKNYQLYTQVRDSRKNVVFNKSYEISKKDRYPFLAHRFTVDFGKLVGVNDLDWLSRFVIFSQLVRSGETEILISDYSLTFKKRIIKGGINTFPKWANKEQTEFFYTSYDKGNQPTLYKASLLTGKQEKITSSEGMLVCSDVSKVSDKILLTMGEDGQPDIYELDLKTKRKTRLTWFNGIDVNGNYVEDDQSFVFVSDRYGNPDVFKSKIGSRSVEQLVFKGKNNNYVDSFNDYAVFVSRDTESQFGRNTFNIYLISVKTEYIRQLTSNGQNFFPRFSSDGKTILYTKTYKNESAIGLIRLNQNKSYLFPFKDGKIQSIDW